MGKGDIKTKKGKMANGSFGNKRRRNETEVKSVAAAPPKAAESKPAPKARAKKAEK